MQVFRRGDAACDQHQSLRRNLQCSASRFERLVFNRVLVGLEQQLQSHRLHRVRQAMGFQFLDILRLHQSLQTLFFNAGLRGFQRGFRCCLVAAFAFFIKVNRRCVQLEQQGRSFNAFRHMAEIFNAEIGISEFILARDFPQEVRFHGIGQRMRGAQQFRRRR